MKKLFLLVSLTALLGIEAEALKLKNEYPDDVTFAVQRFNSAGPALFLRR